MGIAVLGPLAVDRGERVPPRDRVVLEVLVVRAGNVVDKEALADALWGEAPPASWAKVVHGCVARLRRVLGPAAVETTPYGYRLIVHDDELDVRQFETLLGRARKQLDSGDADRASYLLGEAIALWRGPAYPDLTEWEPGRNESGRLDDLRLTAEELRVEAEIRGGRSTDVLNDARSMVTEAPLRERRWALLARALYQAGRQSDSLEVVGRARRMLRDELGLDPDPELVALEQAILRRDPGLAAIDSQPTSDLCPYRGLLSYEAEDADSFFGREADVGVCLKLLRERGTLAIVGPSGSGKSSLVRAGIVAALRSEGRKVVVTTPGPRPLDTLAALPQRGSNPVLVVDQAEEAVTLCADADERAAYFAALGGYAGELIVALRADHLGDLAAYPAFARIIERGLHLLTAMDEQSLRATIERPAAQAGLRLEPGLSDLLVREVEGEPGALPLLSHVLRQTWENREGRTLTVDSYRRTGGVRNALAQSAETLYQGLDDSQREQVRALFLRLVMPSSDGDPVRARVLRSKVALDSAHERLIEELIAARLVTSDDTEIQIAHEALAREWPRLQDWLAQDVEGQQIFRHLASAAESWEQMGRPDSELYRGSRLTAAVEWAERSGPDLTAVERRFLRESLASAEEEMRQTQLRLGAQVRSNRRLRAAFVGALAAALVAAVLTVVAVNQRQEARNQSERAGREARIATARELANAAIANIGVDAERSILLAIQAAKATRSVDGHVLPEAEQALHLTIAASREAKLFAGIAVPIDTSPRGVFVAEPGEDTGRIEIRDVATRPERWFEPSRHTMLTSRTWRSAATGRRSRRAATTGGSTYGIRR
jgi:DNA-binding SARP family transcriptional activator/energy-coupling factor transporter ATP-binding protein EcfA2